MTKQTKILLMIFSLVVLIAVGFTAVTHQNSSTEQKVTVKPKPKTEMFFMVGGDMMFGRYVDYRYKNNLQDVAANLGQNFFSDKDLALVNLEGPISPTETHPNPDPNNSILNFPPATAGVLKWLGINAASLANNHSSNQGQAGLENTRKVLSEQGIKAIGQEFCFDENSIARFKKDSGQISVIAINLLETHDDITSAVVQEKQAGSFVIVFPHWGSEYQKTHSASQEELGHAWIDAGADLVIGSHPHVIQDAEMYKNRPIFYSVGNLLFDQTFSAPTQRGLIVSGKITDKKLTLTLIPTIQKNLKPELMGDEEKTSIINQLRTGLGQSIDGQESGNGTLEINLATE